MSERDTIYQAAMDSVTGFRFDDSVARVFPDMINRSVPGYSTIVSISGVLAKKYARPGTQCYDLGTSLGACTLAMQQMLPQEQAIIAVDNSQAMLDNFRKNLEASGVGGNIELRCEDIQHTCIENASVVILNFTLQFIPPEERNTLVKKIHEGMIPGGVLLLSEKIAFDDPHLQELNTDLHHAFKKAHGYSELEISQKRTALENFLVPETLPAHGKRLTEAGFNSVDVWFQCFNFASMIAIK
jgi:tRNA (cmo5U34)-methyltransferase